MIKKTQINESLLLYCIIYLCSFNFWDTKFGMFFKYFFFCVILIGLIGYGKRLLVNKGKIQTTAKDSVILYIFCIGLFLIQVINVENSSQRNLAFYQYVFFMMMIPSILYLLEYCEIRKILNLFKTIGVVLSIFAIYEVFSGSYIIQNEYLGIMYNGSRVIRAMVFSGSFLTFGTIMAMP